MLFKRHYKKNIDTQSAVFLFTVSQFLKQRVGIISPHPFIKFRLNYRLQSRHFLQLILIAPSI